MEISHHTFVHHARLLLETNWKALDRAEYLLRDGI